MNRREGEKAGPRDYRDYGDSLLNLRLQDRREAYRRSFPVSLPFTGRDPCSQRRDPEAASLGD